MASKESWCAKYHWRKVITFLVLYVVVHSSPKGKSFHIIKLPVINYPSDIIVLTDFKVSFYFSTYMPSIGLHDFDQSDQQQPIRIYLCMCARHIALHLLSTMTAYQLIILSFLALLMFPRKLAG